MAKTRWRALPLPMLVSCAPLTLALTFGSAGAQDATVDPIGLPSPVYSALDSNGVDLVSGRYTVNHPGFSIGSAGSGLAESFSYITEGPQTSLYYALYYENYGVDAQHASGETGFFGPTTFEFVAVPASAPYRVETGIGGETLVGGLVTLQDGTSINTYIPVSSSSTVTVASAVTRPNGETLSYTFNPTPTGHLPTIRSIVSNNGYMLHIDASGKRTLINLSVEYCSPSAETCSLSHTWPTMTITQTSITDPAGRVTSWTGTGGVSGTLTTPEQKAHSYTGYSYQIGSGSSGDASAGKIVQFSNGSGTWTYNYSWNLNVTPISNRVVTIKRTGPDGNITATSFHSCLTSLTDQWGHIKKQECDYNTSSHLHEGRPDIVTFPEGNSVQYGYDGRGNLNSETRIGKDGKSEITVSAKFPANCTTAPATALNCNLPTSTTGGRGNETDYTYADWGGLTSKLGPADITGVRPLKRWFYTQLYAYVMNSSGTLVKASSPVWKLTKEIDCKSTLSSDKKSCGSTADEIVTTYSYGAAGSKNTLSLRSKVVDDVSGGLRLRTCYGYDDVGNVIAETKPNGSTCPS